MATGETTRLGPWPLGMNNRQPDYALPDGCLRNAVNVDIDNQGRLRRRSGYAKIAAAVGAHSGYSCAGGTFYVDGARLLRLNDNNTTTYICDVAGQVAYEYFNGALYFSDGVATRKLLDDGTLMRWGFDVPDAPFVGSIPGAMPAGSYLAAMTYITADGIEHGASDLSEITVTVNSSIQFMSLPQRAGASIRLYLTTANGKTLYHVGTTTADSFTVYDNQGVGMALDKQFISAPPAGSIIRQYKGRMYVALGKVLFHSEPFAFEHFRLGSGFVPLADDIAVMEVVDAGVWVVTTGDTFMLNGESAEAPMLKQVVGYGAIPGTGVKDDATGSALWYSTRGAVVGTADGQIVNMQEANVAADTGLSGAAMLREHDGIKQFVASVRDSTVSPLAASSFIAMEVIRKAG